MAQPIQTGDDCAAETTRAARPEFQENLAPITEAAQLLLAEFEAANANHGAGIHRGPRAILRDLREELNSLREAVGKLRASGDGT